MDGIDNGLFASQVDYVLLMESGVCSFGLGSKKLYDTIDENRDFLVPAPWR